MAEDDKATLWKWTWKQERAATLAKIDKLTKASRVVRSELNTQGEMEAKSCAQLIDLREEIVANQGNGNSND